MSIVVLFFSFFATFFLLWVLVPTLNRRLLDKPNSRSSHQRPTPRGGGIAFVVVTLLSCSLALIQGVSSFGGFICLPFIAFPLSVIGFLDDYHDLSAGLRYGAQLLTAILIIFVSSISFNWFWVPLLLFSITAVINFTNFMDGLDGLVAGCMVVAIGVYAFSLPGSWSIFALIGSLLGFLCWNWSPAKVFMGDVGSTFLGAVFAGLVLQSSSLLDALAYLLVLTPLLGDACICVIRRLTSGQQIFQAHRLHLFQRLHQSGWSHARVSFTYVGVTTLLGVSMIFGGLSWIFLSSVLVLILGFWLDQNVAIPFSQASQLHG